MGPKVHPAVGLCLVATTFAAGAPAAMLNKVAPGRCPGRDGCSSFAEVARVLIADSGDFGQFGQFMSALMAAFFLMCIACLVGGWVKMSQGAPGGGQMMLAAGWGVVVMIICAGVVL